MESDLKDFKEAMETAVEWFRKKLQPTPEDHHFW